MSSSLLEFEGFISSDVNRCEATLMPRVPEQPKDAQH